MKKQSQVREFFAGCAGILASVAAVCIVAQFFMASPEGEAVLGVWAVGAAAALVSCAVVMLLHRRRVRELEALAAKAAEAALGESAPFAGAQDEPGLSLHRLTSELTRYKGLCEGIIGGLPMPFLLVDTQERALHTNQATLDMLQIDGPVERQLGRTLAEIFYNDSSRETAVGKAMHKGQTFRNLDVAIQGHKGGTRHVLANVYALNDSRGNCIGGFCLYLDMTELKAKEAELCEQNERIGRAAEEANEISDRLASGSAEMAAQVEQSSRSSEESRKLTASVAVSVEQMNATVLEVAQKASDAAEISDQARVQADEGAQVVEDAINRISRLEQQATKLSEDMNSLGAQADSIGSIMSVITDIADQTNLLALNAAIEAARAGEAGRGFAVVADEVRKLAEKTMEATKRVEENIRAIQHSAGANVEATKVTSREVAETVEVVRKAGESLTRIVDYSSRTSDDVQSIATAAEEQSAASEEIARATSDINVAADETSQAMSESAKAVEELAELAVKLRKVMDSMRLSNTC